MARIRTIKPEFWADEKLAPLPPITRLVFLGIISMADDRGRLVDNIKQIDALIFSETNDSTNSALDELSQIGRIERGITGSGQRIIQIVNWHHQKIDRPNYSGCLPPIEVLSLQPNAPIRRSLDEASTSMHRTLSVSVSVPVSTIMAEQGSEGAVQTPKTNTRSESPKVLSADESAVLDHYLSRHSRRRVEPVAAKRIIAKALKTFSVSELTLAIDGNATDPWHREHRKHELSYVLRNAELISGFIERATPREPVSTLEVDEWGDPIHSSLVRVLKS